MRDCRRGIAQRKAKEAVFSMAMEAKYSKDDILSIYLNRAYLGGGRYRGRGRGAALFRQIVGGVAARRRGDAGRFADSAVHAGADQQS